jgi:hypothetical protein
LEHAPSGRTEPHPGRTSRRQRRRATRGNQKRDSNRIIVQTDRRCPCGPFNPSMIRGARASPRHPRVYAAARRSDLSSAMVTSARTDPWRQGIGRSSQTTSRERGCFGGHRNNALQNRLTADSKGAAAEPTGSVPLPEQRQVRGGGPAVRHDSPRKQRIEIEGPWRGNKSPREDRPFLVGNGGEWYGPISRAKP